MQISNYFTGDQKIDRDLLKEAKKAINRLLFSVEQKEENIIVKMRNLTPFPPRSSQALSLLEKTIQINGRNNYLVSTFVPDHFEEREYPQLHDTGSFVEIAQEYMEGKKEFAIDMSSIILEDPKIKLFDEGLINKRGIYTAKETQTGKMISDPYEYACEKIMHTYPLVSKGFHLFSILAMMDMPKGSKDEFETTLSHLEFQCFEESQNSIWASYDPFRGRIYLNGKRMDEASLGFYMMLDNEFHGERMLDFSMHISRSSQ